jgi:hypothetical protein
MVTKYLAEMYSAPVIKRIDVKEETPTHVFTGGVWIPRQGAFSKVCDTFAEAKENIRAYYRGIINTSETVISYAKSALAFAEAIEEAKV